ncbi:NAD(P)/FAD-dependent oxidoreductase [Halalkalibacterium ligniniphilum]|uniref:NAD(P)/FAD-dependent oxidoreductase n=1 Tax=Halalkalibacterium ligniniphilum TaxID=1134413 RepID=UPI000348982A|nr:FAD-dependent oxidoreductase [Halalkalibacterium ligniniphilum]
MTEHYDVIIIGAGLSGLMAARTVAEAGLRYLVLDKGKSVGGRMATRRIGEGRADHGAQFFTARSETMKNYCSEWEEKGWIQVWTNGFHQLSGEGGSLVRASVDGYPRYKANDGMNALTKKLANGLSVKTEVKVNELRFRNKQWAIEATEFMSHKKLNFSADAVLSTAPVPQSLALLLREDLESDVKEELEALLYEPCLCALLVLEGPSGVPDNGGIQGDGIIAFIGDNQKKGISASPIVTVQASGAWSLSHYNDDEEELLKIFIHKIRPLIGNAAIKSAQLKKWRYAKPSSLYPDRFLAAMDPGPIAFAGDAFKEGKVEGAILSGLEAGKWLMERQRHSKRQGEN